MLGQYDPNSHPVTSHSRSTTNTKDSYSSNTGVSRNEMENYVKSLMASTQSQPISTQLAPQQIQPLQPTQPPQPSRPYYGPQPSGTYQTIQDANIGRFIQWITGEVPEFVPVPKPDLPPKPQTKKVEVDSDEELANLTKRQLKLHVAKAVRRATKSQHRCSNCNRTGHNSRNCKYKKRKSKSKSKKKGTVNKVGVNSSSESDASSSDNESNSGSDSESASESESDSVNDLTETEIVKIINAVNDVKSKKK